MRGLSLLAALVNDSVKAALSSAGYDFLLPILETIDTALIPIIICVLAAGTIYAVVLGVNMAKAESSDKREEAKKRLINVIIGFAVVILLLVVIYALAANINSILGIATKYTTSK
jgi:cytochrome c biogenesis protein CcdA